MVLVLFAVFVVVGLIVNVLLCLALDQIFSPTVGALTFVLLYFAGFAFAWLLAVWMTERREAKARPPGDQNWDRTPQHAGR